MSKVKLNLFITPDGVVNAVYHDALRQLLPGKLQVKRASHVEFNEAFQRWEARRPNGSVMCMDSSREACLKLEKLMVEAEIYSNVAYPILPTHV